MLRRLALPLPGAARLPRLTTAEIATFFAIAAGLDLLLGFQYLSPVLHGGLVSPDSYMRLVRIRQGLAEGGLFHPHLGQIVLSDGSGWGTVLHWSRFFDGTLLLLAAPLTALMTDDQALHLAGAAIGPIGMGLLGVAAAWAILPLADRRWLWSAPLLVGLSNVLDGYGVFGYADHHVLLVLSVIVMAGAAGRAAFGGRAGGIIAGVASAVGIWISPETMPFDLLGFAAVVIGWSLTPALVGPALRRFSVSLMGVVGLALLIDPPVAGYGAAEVDRLSIVYLTMAVLLVAVVLLLQPLRRLTRPMHRLLAAAIAGGSLFGGWVMLFPAVLAGPDGLMPPEIRAVFFDRIEEMKPVETFADVALYLGSGLFATVVALMEARRQRSPLWLFAAIAGALTVLIGALHVRFATYSAGMAAVMIPLAVTRAGSWAERRQREPRAGRPVSESFPAIVRVAVLTLFLMVPLLPSVGAKKADAAAPGTAATPTCALDAVSDMLRPYPGQVVLTSADDAPEVLYRAPVKTVGSLYHRNIPGFMRLHDAWMSPPSATVPPALTASRATLVLACPTHAAAASGKPPASLADQLDADAPPPWLEQVAADGASGLRLYRLR